MGWGGLFSDEPIAEILSAVIHETSITHLDRWYLEVQPNTSCSPIDPTNQHGNNEEGQFSDEAQSSLPLTVMNNYFR
jgi:hypothetical protein